MSKKGFLRGIQVAVHVVFILLLVPVQSVHAAAQLEIAPITWNVIGLDSNNVNVGPNNFPVGARVCNTGNATANNVSSAFQWETVDPTPAKNYIDTRLGSALSYSGYTLNPSQCVDFYYEVEVTRNSNAYNDTRRYYITATADTLGTVSTPRPRELFVEYLVSQSRNSTTDVKLDGVSVAPGGTMALVVGQTYNITLVAKTATNGYEQIESFINFPNTIFQVNSVNTTYSADTSTYVSNPSDMLYGDGCRWENDPNSPKYRSCWDVGKAGGNITVDYNVTIIGGAGTSNILNTLIYDFSGSSYHYNADYSVGGRIAVIIDPAAVTIAKNFNPDPTNVNGISKLTFTLTNPNGAAVSGVNFSDTFPTTPGAMTVANPPNASTSGCGTPTFLPTAGSGSVSFSNGTIAANGTCTVSVDVTVPVVGSYNNTSSNVFVGTVDTGHNASDTLTVNTQPPAPACTDGVVLARWDFTGSTLTATIPNPAKVSSAIASYTGTGTSSFDTTLGNPTPSWKVTSGWAANNTGYPNAGASPYFQFLVDTSNFTNVKIQYDYKVDGNWANSANNYLYTYINANGGAYSHINTVTGFTKNDPFATVGPVPSAATTTGTSTTGFRINAVGQQSSTAAVLLDNVIITGCGVPDHPTLTKAFSPDPVAVNGTSTLTFTITNPNPNVALSGLAFTDSLPAGVTVANGGPTSVCGGSLTTTAPSTISFTGGSLASGGSCNIPVTVTVTTAGPHTNVSGFISSTQTGTNSTSTGSASDTITAILPPAISKLFSPNPILVNGTSTLTFTINNPNQNDSLTGVAFSDTYPAGLVNASPLSTSTSCGGTVTAAAGGGSVSFSGGTISGGSTCTVTVDVTAASANTYNNTSGAVTANITGGTDTASDSLVVEAPAPAISFLKQVGLTNNPNGAWSNFLSVTTNQNVYYKFIIENIGDVPFSPISVSDLALQGTGADPAGCSWPATLPVADSNDDDHIAVCVVGPISAASGSHLNTATASGTYGGSNYTDTSSATYATVGLSINKTAIETYFTAENDQLHYSYAVENTGSAPLVGPVTVTDDKATVSCPAVDTVGDNDNYLDPGEILTCTATYTVTAADVATGSVTNTAFATTDGVNSPNDDLTIPKRLPDLTISKANSVSGTAVAGSSFTWTLTVSNIGLLNAAFADGQTLLSDPLPAGATYGSPSAGSFTDITNSGNISCSIDGSNVLTCVASGSSVTVGASTGSFTVSFTATPTAGGSLSNTATVDPNNNVAETNETNNTGTNSLFVFDAAPAKSIVDTSEDSTTVVSGSEKVAIGEMVRYRISAQLPEGSFTNVQFVDNLPDGLQFLDDGTAKVAFVCTNTGSDCITSSTLSGASLLVTGNSPGVTPAFALPGGAISGGPFTSGVNPTFSLGNLVNSDGDSDLEYVVIEFNALVLNVNSSVTINQGTNNVDGTNVTNSRSNNVDFRVNSVKVGATSSNATISVAEPAITNLAKSVSAGPYLPGGTVTYSLTFSNTASGTNATTAFDIVLTDVLDANLTPGTVGITSTQGTSGVDSCAGGTTFTAGSTTTGQTVTVNISCLDPGKSVTVTIGATIGSVASGTDIDNATSLTYTSLPGANGSCAVAPFTCTNIGGTGSGTGERNGSGGAGADSAILNNYADASTTVKITVAAPVIDAVDDDYSGTPVNGFAGGNAGNAFTNDTLNGVAVNAADITATVVTPPPTRA